MSEYGVGPHISNIWHNSFGPVAERGEASKPHFPKPGSLRLRSTVDRNWANRKEAIVRLERSLKTMIGRMRKRASLTETLLNMMFPMLVV